MASRFSVGHPTALFGVTCCTGRGATFENREPSSLHHRRVRNNGVAQARVAQAGQHRRLHHGDDLAGLEANYREAANGVIVTDQLLHETLSFVGRLHPQ